MMIHSFLLIGQSNMAGRGFFDEAIEVDSSRISVLRNGRWMPMYRPVNNDRSFSGVNLAEKFAELYAKKYNVMVGLIPCADGGTRLDQWEPGSLLFDHAVFQAKLAQRSSTIAGVLWHQGESDCDPMLYPTYQPRFEAIMNAFRKELDLYDVPFILGKLGDFLAECDHPRIKHLENYHHVNDALEKIAASNPMTALVSAEGLTANADQLHFNAKSLYEFGIRYFEQFEKTRDTNKVFVEKDCADAVSMLPIEAL